MLIQAFNFKPFAPDAAEAAAQAAAAALESEAAPEVPAAPVFTAEDISAAESKGYVKGLEEGQAKGREDANTEIAMREQQLSRMIDNMATEITAMAQSHKEFLEQQARHAGPLAQAIARKVATNALANQPLAEIEAMVAECLPMLSGQPKFIITLSPPLAELLKARIQPILRSQGVDGECIIEGDPAMQAEDCRIDWKNGAAEKNGAALWKEIEAVIERMAAPEQTKIEIHHHID